MPDEETTDTSTLLPGSEDIYEASAMPLRIVLPEDLDGDGQMPYEKTDRVGELFLPLQDLVLTAPHLADGEPLTAGMLRMMLGRSEGRTDGSTWRVGLFDVLAVEGGRPIGHVIVVRDWHGVLDFNEVGPLIEDGGEAFDRYQSIVAHLEAGALPDSMPDPT